MNTVLATDHQFIGHLEKLVKEQDRGALADLRRGLGKTPGTAREMDRHVLPYLSPVTSEYQEYAYYLVSALFAGWYQGKNGLHPFSDNLGASLRMLVDSSETGSREDAKKREGNRLVALLSCHRDDLWYQLRHIIGLLKAKDIPVDWLQLLFDIQNWAHESRSVQRNWARKFWRGYQPEKGTGTEDTQPTNEENEEEE